MEKGIPLVTPTVGKAQAVEVVNTVSAVPSVEPEKTIATQMDYDQLIVLPVEAIWEQWRGTLDNNQTDQSLATAALAQKLRQGDGEAIYAEAAEMLRNTAFSASQRAQIVNFLGETSTVQALEVLAQLSSRSKVF